MRWEDGDTFVAWDNNGKNVGPGMITLESCANEYGQGIPCPQGFEVIIRLIGIDAPETRDNQKAAHDATEWDVSVDEINSCGRQAHGFAAAIAPNGISVTIITSGKDRYGRTLGYAYLESGENIEELLLRNGMAISRYRHSSSKRYDEIEREAAHGKRGFHPVLWRTRNRR